MKHKFNYLEWCRLTDSNRGPPHYEGGRPNYATHLIRKGFTWINRFLFEPASGILCLLFAVVLEGFAT